jgi:DNA-binding SARP family transcriptional activator
LCDFGGSAAFLVVVVVAERWSRDLLDGLTFYVLGPLEVRQNGELVAITAPMQRAVLASLLVRIGGVVALSTIAQDIWGDNAPKSAAVTVRNYVRRLRHLLPEPVIERAAGGYRLAVAAESTDLHRFLAQVDRARAERSDRLFRTALALWRGSPLRDLAGVPLRTVFAQRWEETYLAALEEHCDLRLALGQHATLIAELAEYVRQYPLRETMSGQLMIALHASGRASEALSHYRGVRARLVDEQGIEPGYRLQFLQKAILRGDMTLPWRGGVLTCADCPRCVRSLT